MEHSAADTATGVRAVSIEVGSRKPEAGGRKTEVRAEISRLVQARQRR